jgi:hypothetical protein
VFLNVKFDGISIDLRLNQPVAIAWCGVARKD